MHPRRVAASHSFVPYGINATDATRSTLTVSDRDRCLRLVDGDTLAVRRAWRLGEDAIGTHAVRPADEVALVSCVRTVELLDPDGQRVWTHRHEAGWDHGNFAHGCAWFDNAGEPFALVPRAGYDGCEIVHLDRRDGRPLERATVDTDPAGADAIHHADGWVGLSVGEGQDRAIAWWTRLGAGRLELIAAGWKDEVLFDVDPTGAYVLTTPHSRGPVRIRSFPDLAIVREIEAPPETWWDFYACFAGEHLVAKTVDGDDVETLVAVDPAGTITTLAHSEHPITPGQNGSWLASTPEGLERWTLDP